MRTVGTVKWPLDMPPYVVHECMLTVTLAPPVARSCARFGIGDLVVRTLVGLLVAVGTAASAFVGLVHGELIGIVLSIAATAAGLAAFASAPSKKIF